MGHHRQRRTQPRKVPPRSLSIARQQDPEELDAQRRQRVDGRNALTPKNVLFFQQMVGNRAVQRMVQRQPAKPPAPIVQVRFQQIAAFAPYVDIKFWC